MCFSNLRGDFPDDLTNQPIRVVPLMPKGMGTVSDPLGSPFGPANPLVREANPTRALPAASLTDSEGKARTNSSVPKSVWGKGPMSEREYKQAMAREQGRRDGEKVGMEPERTLDRGVQSGGVDGGLVNNNRSGMRWLGY